MEKIVSDLDVLRDLFAFYNRIAEFDEDLVSWQAFQECIEKHRHDPDVVRMINTIKNEDVDTSFYRKFFKYIFKKEDNRWQTKP